MARERAGREFSIVVVAEGAHAKDGQRSVVEKEQGMAERLGGIGDRVAERLEEMTGKDTRVVNLGHLLRGGGPTARDRLLALRFGAAAVRGLARGCYNCMVALDPPDVRYVPLHMATRRLKTVPLDSDLICTARELGICFGD
jgi:6-phosphofructokinase 1